MFSDVLLTVDFDRTLTDPDSRIPEINLRAIRFFMTNGGTFTVNTGRSVPMCRKFQDLVPVNAPLLVYNGAAWYDPKTAELSNCYLIDADPKKVVEDVQGQFPELLMEIQGVKAHYAFREDPIWQAYCEDNNGTWAYADPRETGPFLKFSLAIFESCQVADVYKSIPWEQEIFRKANNYIREKYAGLVDTTFACPRILDIQAKDVSKSRSAQDLKKKLGKKILVCVGDARNDISMLDGADYAFCPADGVVADRYPNVCPCGEGAVAEVIYKKIPEILGIQLDNQK